MTKKTRISFHLELMKPGVPATWSAQPSVHLNIMSHAGVSGVRPVNNPRNSHCSKCPIVICVEVWMVVTVDSAAP